ncbi:Nitric oxide synthase, brain, partial [Stegodyphus mimosarum]
MENSTQNWPVTILVRVMKRTTGGLGIVVRPRIPNKGIAINELIRGGEADKTGFLRPGDVILRVNDKELCDLSYDECLQVLQDLPNDEEVSILVRALEGYTTKLVTTFDEGGSARTIRIMAPIPNCNSPIPHLRRESISEDKIR